MSQLEDAIAFYCKMLPCLDGEANPQEDTRLYTISYFSFKSNLEVTPGMFLKHLEDNEQLAKYSSPELEVFVNKKIEEINRAKYILSRIPAFLV